MRISISNNTSSQISCDVATIPPAGKLIVFVEDDKLDNVLSELQKLGTSITYRLLDQVASVRSITEPLTLYVTTSGSDSNSGTVRDPFKTIQAALDSLKDVEITAPVKVNVGAGTFDGFVLGTGLKIVPPKTSSDLDFALAIVGTLGAPIVGTVTSSTFSSPIATVVDTTKSWVVNELVGRLCFLNGNSVGIIVSNTSDSFDVLRTLAATAGQTYSISTLDTTVIGSTGTGTPYANSGKCSIAVYGNSGFAAPLGQSSSAAASPILISSFNILAPTGVAQAISVRGSTSLVIDRSKISNSVTGTCVNARAPAQLQLGDCYFSVASAAITLTDARLSIIGVSILQTGASGNAISLSQPAAFLSTALSIYIRSQSGSSAGSGISIIAGYCAAMQNTKIEGFATGIDVGGTGYNNNGRPAIQISTTNTISNCTTGISVGDSGVVGLVNSSSGVSGTGNTTAISVNRGGKLRLASNSTITGTTEISVDGATSTLAAMRALTPKVFPGTPNAYGSYVYE